LELQRHRLFESNWDIGNVPADVCGKARAISVFGSAGKVKRNAAEAAIHGPGDWHISQRQCNTLMGTYWIRTTGRTGQAIPSRIYSTHWATTNGSNQIDKRMAGPPSNGGAFLCPNPTPIPRDHSESPITTRKRDGFPVFIGIELK